MQRELCGKVRYVTMNAGANVNNSGTDGSPLPTEEDALSSYDFHLPPERIAQHPAARREQSRLMVLRGDCPPEHCFFRDLPDLLQPGDLLVRNDTRVIPARLIGKRPGGGKTEALLTHPAAQDPAATAPGPACDGRHGARWVCLARPAGHLKPGKIITFADGALTATVISQLGEGRVLLEFSVASNEELLHQIDQIGEVPLPPYIARKEGISEEDKQRYQTTFARTAGAVAAPTAGLHFTPEIDRTLRERGVEIAHLTLHVGPGTFRPINVEDLREFRLDGEFYCISPETAGAVNRAKKEGRRVITVGTTSTRTIEYAAKEDGTVRAGSGWANLFIHPGHRWRIVDGLLTNFHLPKSSLIVLVSALIGRKRVLDAYRIAIENEYRFYSYGDAMLLLP